MLLELNHENLHPDLTDIIGHLGKLVAECQSIGDSFSVPLTVLHGSGFT